MGIEFRKQQSGEASQNTIVESLRSAGMNSLESVDLINFRLLHGTWQDGASAADRLLELEKRPEIILLELVHTTEDILDDIQSFVHGERVSFPHIRNAFVEALATALRAECMRTPSYRPLIVCSEARDREAGTYKVDQAIQSRSGTYLILFDRFRGDSYEYLLNIYKDATIKLVEAQKERDNSVANNFTKRLVEHKLFASLKNATSIRVAAPYGVQHGRLGGLFKEMGAQVYSGATTLLNRPSDKCEFLLKYGQPVPDSVFEESMLGYIVESVLEFEDDYKSLRESQRNALAWNVLRLVLQKYGSYEAAVTDFRKEMRSKGQSTSFSRNVLVAMSDPTSQKYAHLE